MLCGWTGLSVLLAQAAPSSQPSPESLLPQIEKLLRGGAPAQVIDSYIQTWSSPYLTSLEDLLELRNLGASPNLLSRYARRGAELRLKAHQSSLANTNFPSILILPAAGYRDYSERLDYSPGQGPLYPFSDALPWVVQTYAFAYNWPPYGFWHPGRYFLGRRR